MRLRRSKPFLGCFLTRLLKVRTPVSCVKRLDRKCPPLRDRRTPDRGCPSSDMIYSERGIFERFKPFFPENLKTYRNVGHRTVKLRVDSGWQENPESHAHPYFSKDVHVKGEQGQKNTRNKLQSDSSLRLKERLILICVRFSWAQEVTAQAFNEGSTKANSPQPNTKQLELSTTDLFF